MNEVSLVGQQLRPYIAVAVVFLVIGIGIGMNIGGTGPPPYEPPVFTEHTTTTDGPDVTLAMFAGATGAVIVVVLVTALISRKKAYRSYQ